MHCDGYAKPPGEPHNHSHSERPHLVLQLHKARLTGRAVFEWREKSRPAQPVPRRSEHPNQDDAMALGQWVYPHR
jgi:hypothetical protein